MKVLCIIPARGSSKRLKNKNIRPLLNRPLIGYTIEAALESRFTEKIVVSTDDIKIAKVAAEYGIEVIDRPRRYALDTSPIELALRHAVEYLSKKEGYLADIIVWLQANIPIRKEGQIDAVIKKLIESKADSAATIYKVSQFPQWMKEMSKSGYLSPFFPSSRKYRSQDIKPLYLLDGAIVAVKTDVLMKTKGLKGVHIFLGSRILGIVQEVRYALEVDDADDLVLAEFYLNRAG